MDKGTLIRTIVLTIALCNQFLVVTDLNPIPGSEALWGEVISSIFTSIVAAWAWFKNNYITAKGKKQRAVIHQHKLD
ncbi:phage holin [Cytobacillus horneckiae]|uniref:phage holin n=1 Tax=Cytobacillus horneckiae TaxID=549687 RepID=UPI00399F1838